MTVIAASSVRVQTMADGTLRVTMDVEPRDAQAAFALFATPGTPMALAALKAARAAPKTEVGPVCQWAVMRCQDAVFWDWLTTVSGRYVGDEEAAKEIVCSLCGIESRKELDADTDALERFHTKVRLPFSAWLKKQPALSSS